MYPPLSQTFLLVGASEVKDPNSAPSPTVFHRTLNANFLTDVRIFLMLKKIQYFPIFSPHLFLFFSIVILLYLRLRMFLLSIYSIQKNTAGVQEVHRE